MLSRLVTAIAVSVFTVAGLASHASAAGTPLPIKIGLIKPGKLYKSVSKPVTTFQIPAEESTEVDPIALGGSVTVAANGGELTCNLLAQAYIGTEGWKGLGNPKGSKGWKYLNKSAPAGGAGECKMILIKEKVIKILAKGAGTIPVNAPGSNSEVSIELNAGDMGYCALGVPSIGDPPQHFKEIEGTLLKMKDQAAPAACKGCGDNEVNQPGEECDGTDASACACPAACLPPGDENECTCALGCGNNCVEGGEQCDGTDADQCAGLCLPNCTCPEPVCNNGVKEVGEECDPAGSTADCPVGEICGGFCECVPDVACACGSPDPTRYEFKDVPPSPGAVCGTTDGIGYVSPSNPASDLLKCGGLYIGGGGGSLSSPAPIPDESNPKWNIDQCHGTDLTLAATTPAEVGARHCTQGTACVGGSDDGEPCLRDRDCELDNCGYRCFFTSYVANLDRDSNPVSTCLGTVISQDATGGVDCATGRTFTRVPMDVRIHLTGSDQSTLSTPGYQVCPICVGGTVNVPDSGHCEGGPNGSRCSACAGCPFIQCGDDSDCPPPRTCDIRPCMPMTTTYDLRNCCVGGLNPTYDCEDNSDCEGGVCTPGCTGYPTSLDCPPHPLTDLGGLLVTLNLNTEGTGAYKNTVAANAEGEFCGWCRDVAPGGSLCFEGDPDEGPPGGARGCPDSAVVACRPYTYWNGVQNPADLAECHDAIPCRTDADCVPPYETCTQRDIGAYRDTTIRNMVYDQGTRPGDLTDRAWHSGGIMVTNICIPPTFDGTKDGASSLPGPGGISIIAESRLSPSGAFMETASGLLD